MRTIKVEIHSKLDRSTEVVVSTEVIIEDESPEEIATAGADAREAIDAFVQGYGEGM